jgi:hypothetical protein
MIRKPLAYIAQDRAARGLGMKKICQAQQAHCVTLSTLGSVGFVAFLLEPKRPEPGHLVASGFAVCAGVAA